LALRLARGQPDVELVSVDAMQVYRGMDIGTAKPTRVERAEIRHHLIDVVDPSDDYTVARYGRDLRPVLHDIAARRRRAVLVGGTGLYLRAALGDLEIPGRYPAVAARLAAEPDTPALHEELAVLDPVAAARMEPTNRRRVLRALEVTIGSGHPFSSYGPGLMTYPTLAFRVVGLAMARDELDRRIEARFGDQMAAGFLDEVAELTGRPGGMSRTAGQALGYRELAEHLAGRASLDEAVAEAITRTRRFHKRQLRWFRRDPRIEWHEPGENAFVAAAAALGD
jgi:tRNA dimethylallyltransferase